MFSIVVVVVIVIAARKFEAYGRGRGKAIYINTYAQVFLASQEKQALYKYSLQRSCACMPTIVVRES